MKKLRVFETFAGIGAQHKALAILKSKIQNFDFEIAGISEWDIWANISYNAIHHNNKNIATNLSEEELNAFFENYTFSNDGKKPLEAKNLIRQSRNVKELLYSSIKNSNNLGNISEINGQKLIQDIGDFDLLTYSFPCQDLSVAGSFHGFNKGMSKGSNTRSGLLWEIERILQDLKNIGKQPKYLLLENVRNMISKKHKDDYVEWLESLNALGYSTKTYVLNASEYGLPQARKRVYALSFLEESNEGIDVLNFLSNNEEIKDISEEFKIKKTLKELLKIDYNNQLFCYEALDSIPNRTLSRKRMFYDNPKVFFIKKNKDGSAELKYANQVRTITTKQDRHPNAGVIDIRETSLFWKIDPKKKAKYRFLTPRETFLLMGFEDGDFNKVKKNVSNNAILYRQAGNSIAVNVLVALFSTIKEREWESNG